MMRRFWIFVAVLTLTAGGLAAQQSEARGDSVATAHVTGTMLVVSPQVGYTGATLRIAGPGNYALSKRFPADSPISADLILDAEPQHEEAREHDIRAALPDGRYRYELVLATGSREPRRTTGLLFVENGVPVTRNSKRAALAATRRGLAADRMSSQQAGSEGEIGGETLYVDDYVVIFDSNSNGFTGILFDSSHYSEASPVPWQIRNDGGDMAFYHYDADVADEYITHMILRTDGRVGIGTAAPLANLHVDAPGFSNRLRLQAGAGFRDLVTLGDGGFEIQGPGGGSERAVRIFPNAPDNSLVLRTNGIGVGTDNPAAQLHVVDSGALPMRLTGDGHNFDLLVGSAGLHLRDNAGNVVAQFNHSAPQNALVVNGAGVGIGTASPSARLHVAGTFRADGDVALHSSRTVKTGFAQVSPAEILARIADLPVASWRYKTDDEDKRHIGPFAEDFQRLFGLGDGETISVIDAQGVTLAAIQGLQQTLADKDAEIAQLNQRLTARDNELRERIERLEHRLGDQGRKEQ